MSWKPFSILALLLALAAASASSAQVGAPPRRPNVVFILADDLGWRDTSLYGSRYHRTPNIDALAKRGMRLDRAYAANPLCSPTRASILTGLYPARIGITSASGHLPEAVLEASLRPRARSEQKAQQANSATRLKHEYVTLAETLRKAGYRTGHFGKWHLGPEPYDPLHQGFDVDVPRWHGPGPGGAYIAPWKFPEKLMFQGQPGEHVEDRLAEEAARFIRENRDRPFFLNYWAFSVHSPWGAKPELVQKYRALADPNSPQRNPVYAAMVESLDDAVGRLVKALDEHGLAENTILVFTSDNGGVHFAEVEGAAVTSNAPLRAGKATLYEGGTREPCLVVWPGTVHPGSRSSELVQSIDWHPTLLQMTGLAPEPGQRFDGISIVPALKGGKLGRDTLFCHFPHYTPATGGRPGTYVRKGEWKLIRFYADNGDQTDRLELYNLGSDEGETKNLAGSDPDKVRELNALIDGFLKDTGAVVPVRNPAYVEDP